jgi:nicotinamidase-related amidase
VALSCHSDNLPLTKAFSSSFQNTDLDYQLRQRGVRHLVMAGLVAETCLESTTRYAYEK